MNYLWILLWITPVLGYLRGNKIHPDLKPFLGTWNVLYTKTRIHQKNPNCEKIYYFVDDSLQFRYKHSKMIENQEWKEYEGYIHLSTFYEKRLHINGDWQRVKSMGSMEYPFFQHILYMNSKDGIMITSDEKREKFHILTRPHLIKTYTQTEGIKELNSILRNENIGKLQDFYQENHSFCYL